MLSLEVHKLSPLNTGYIHTKKFVHDLVHVSNKNSLH